MPSIQSQLDAAFRKAIQQAFGFDADPILQPSANDKFGDYQSNAAMGLAKQAKSNPRQVAEKIIGNLQLGEMASEVTIAGPGFINVRLNPAFLAAQLQNISADQRLGLPLASSRQHVVVDYSAPNIAKEMHVGHLRSTIIGDAISRVIEFRGDKVTRQNHIGDWGTQFGMLIAHAKSQVGDLSGWLSEALASIKESSDTKREWKLVGDLETFYREAKRRFDDDASFAEQARQTVVRLQAHEDTELALWQIIVDATRQEYQPIYERLGVKLRPEHERGESSYNAMLPQVVADLKEKKIAVESEGATVVFVPNYENPLIIEKSGGGYLYGTTDLAAIRYRTNDLHANRIIYTTDSRQSQHFAQVFWTARQASWTHGEKIKLEHAPFGTMLGEDGKPFKSRSGELIKLKELLDEAEARGYELAKQKEAERLEKAKARGDDNIEPLSDNQLRAIGKAVGIGGIKYADLSKDRISDYVFSWEKMLAMDGNTAPYLQYAHARIKSIFRKAGAPQAGATMKLESPFEIALAKHVLRLGEIIDLVARELKPHHLCTYLYELATKFSSFYENCPVIQSEEPTRSSRLLLCDATAKTLAIGLDLLGIEHPEQM